MFIAALVTIGRRWNQPKCPSMDEWKTNCDISRQWNTIQLQKTMQYRYILQGG